MKIDHGFMTVYYELDQTMELPMVPIVLNCTTPPLMTLRQSYEFGKRSATAIRSYDGWSGSASSAPAGCRTSSVSRGSATSTRTSTAGSSISWRRCRLSDELLDMPNDELMEAGNGTGEVRAWVAVGGRHAGPPGDDAGLRADLRVDQRDGRHQLPDVMR